MFLMTTILVMSLSGSVTADGVDVDVVSSPEQTQSPVSPTSPEPAEQQAEAKESPTPAHTGIRTLLGDLVEDIKHLPDMQKARGSNP